MKAARFHQVGGPETLVFEDVPDAVAGPGEVLIRIEAVGLNFADVMRRRGDAYPEPSPTPFTLGIEVAGTIEALGDGVTGFDLGAAVMATPGAGGYAQFIAVPAAMVVPLPPGVPAVLAAAVVAHGASASIALRHAAKLQPGETVLIEGAAGGLGSFAIQLAKQFGAGKVIAAASTPEKRALAEKLGADATVDYTQPDWAQKVRDLTDGRGVDVVLETAGGDTAVQALQTLAPFGRMIYIGQSSAQAVAGRDRPGRRGRDQGLRQGLMAPDHQGNADLSRPQDVPVLHLHRQWARGRKGLTGPAQGKDEGPRPRPQRPGLPASVARHYRMGASGAAEPGSDPYSGAGGEWRSGHHGADAEQP